MNDQEKELWRIVRKLRDYWLKKPGWVETGNFQEQFDTVARLYRSNWNSSSMSVVRNTEVELHKGYSQKTLTFTFETKGVRLFSIDHKAYLEDLKFTNEELKWLDANGYTIDADAEAATGQRVEDWVYDES